MSPWCLPLFGTGITNTVGRVLTGVLANLNKIDSLVINNIAMLLCGVTTFIYPFCQSYELLCFIAAVFGLSVGQYWDRRTFR